MIDPGGPELETIRCYCGEYPYCPWCAGTGVMVGHHEMTIHGPMWVPLFFTEQPPTETEETNDGTRS